MMHRSIVLFLAAIVTLLAFSVSPVAAYDDRQAFTYPPKYGTTQQVCAKIIAACDQLQTPAEPGFTATSYCEPAPEAGVINVICEETKTTGPGQRQVIQHISTIEAEFQLKPYSP